MAPWSVAFYDTWPGNDVGLFSNATEPTRGAPIAKKCTVN